MIRTYEYPLHRACYLKDPTADEIRSLIAGGIPVDQLDSHGHTAISYACFHGTLDTIRCLIECGADVFQTNMHSITLLHQACYLYSSQDTIPFLMKCGLRADAKSVNGTTPLHLACQRSTLTLDTLRILVEERDINMNERDSNGRTALHHACLIPHTSLDIIEYFVANGADVTIVCDYGTTALFLVCVAWRERLTRSLRDCVDFESKINCLLNASALVEPRLLKNYDFVVAYQRWLDGKCLYGIRALSGRIPTDLIWETMRHLCKMARIDPR